MSTLKRDPLTGDLAVETNKLVLVSGADEVRQLLDSNLGTYEGEWFLDPTIGIPYHREVFVKGVSPNRIASIFKRAILLTKGVLELREYNQDLDGATRKLTIDFMALSQDGKELRVNREVG